MDLLSQTMRALAFLSRIPVGPGWFGHEGSALSANARAFPLAGALIALPALVLLIGTRSLGLPELVVAIFVVGTLIITTGALHEDGLADVADGFYGGQTTERRLEIMKDSAVGSYGVIALILSLSLRIALLAELLDELDFFELVLAIIATESASRAVLVKFWQSLPSVRPGGIADSSGIPTGREADIALLIGFAFLVVGYGVAGGIPGIVAACILAALAYFGLQAICRAKIGGQTGDTLGAIQQVSAIALQIGLVISL
ncbi:adenosylcobinamide-GDP ribazoletransferase [Phyllobacterium sp. 21LDTY02-6]|jgi:adenosylcobinamide-GDP ribazoletransferase|uniref:adenosylcobinamide-GDP ribazoletransferase n=1 Tax=Phyllobacterium sp. 21LDTY02-6 TaxID=2944903 RepID=UPI002020E063|nr:adenosylcobinamide-GDP ribazoletransferase [Phyllobacterium sp. 21LDTY02-6]MCO4316153.1 adenosylcobinamide-GDP ribazoletransferase [Phyllobacterium sp. 21LDTY02-6]